MNKAAADSAPVQAVAKVVKKAKKSATGLKAAATKKGKAKAATKKAQAKKVSSKKSGSKKAAKKRVASKTGQDTSQKNCQEIHEEENREEIETLKERV